MPVLRSRLDPRAPRRAPTTTRWPRSSPTCATARPPSPARGAGGDDRSIARHRERGKLPVRERIDRLLDPGSAFLELSPLAATGLYDDDAPGAGIVTGIGRIEGTTCVIVANDATVKGGTYYPMTVKKHLRAQEIALENRLPCVYLVDSGGAFLPLQADVFPDRDHFGRIFYNQARMSAAGIPQVALVMGSSHGRRRLRPGDERRDRHRQGHRHDLPRRPAAREGRDRRGRHAEDLGGAERPHRDAPASPTTRRSTTSTRSPSAGRSSPTSNRKAAGAALGPARARAAGGRSGGADRRRPTSTPRSRPTRAGPSPVREIIARLVDGSRFHEFKPLYGETLVTGFAHIDGYPVGDPRQRRDPVQPVGAQGRPLHRARVPAPDPARLPPEHHRVHGRARVRGRRHRQGRGQAGHRGRLAPRSRSSRSSSAAAFGAGNYAMAGRAYQPRFLWTWPNSRISRHGRPAGGPRPVDGRRRRSPTTPSATPSRRRSSRRYEREGSPYFATARLWDDGVIDPLDTRRVLAMGIEAALHAPIPETRFGVFRM